MPPSGKQSLSYRPDIDGLRAIAVLSVVAYHLSLGGVSAGFVGVDIFFVISGFLITSIVHREISSSSFSLVKFYERRIRRIVPALTCVLVISCIVAWYGLLPQEFDDFAKSLVAAVLSVSNILFWRQAGYFDTPSELKPLLHTWSLGVEEQFYLFFPPLLMWISRHYKNSLRKWIIGIAIISFAVSAWGVFTFPTATFYLIDTRAWELMIGAMLALEIFPSINGTVQRNIASIGGLLLIGIADFVFTASTPFPGAAALLPCLGAALIIAAGKTGTSFVGKLLSIKPLIFIGLISYSLYLWHWPIFVFHRAGVLPTTILGHHMGLGVLAESVIAAVLSWRFVEMPFRAGSIAPSTKPLFWGTAVSTAVIAVFAIIVIFSGGVPNRFTPDAVTIGSYLANGGDLHAEREGTCLIDLGHPFKDFRPDICLNMSSDKPNLLLLGDSHAGHLWKGLSTQFPEFNLLQASAAGCPPFFVDADKRAAYCNDLRVSIKQFLLSHKLDGIILSADWTASQNDLLTETLIFLRTLQTKIYLVGPNPKYDLPLPRLLALSTDKRNPGLAQQHLLHDAWSLDQTMQALASQQHLAGYISLVHAMCPDDICTEYAESLTPTEADENHFTAAGSILIAKRIRQTNVLP
jgi:peptidoglycan/LPS O-acetylase OafA/YrhL